MTEVPGTPRLGSEERLLPSDAPPGSARWSVTRPLTSSGRPGSSHGQYRVLRIAADQAFGERIEALPCFPDELQLPLYICTPLFPARRLASSVLGLVMVGTWLEVKAQIEARGTKEPYQGLEPRTLAAQLICRDRRPGRAGAAGQLAPAELCPQAGLQQQAAKDGGSWGWLPHRPMVSDRTSRYRLARIEEQIRARVIEAINSAFDTVVRRRSISGTALVMTPNG